LEEEIKFSAEEIISFYIKKRKTEKKKKTCPILLPMSNQSENNSFYSYYSDHK